MEHFERIPEDPITAKKLETLNERVWDFLQDTEDGCSVAWGNTPAFHLEQRSLMMKQRHVRSMLRARQEVESLPDIVWSVLSGVAQQIREMRQQLVELQRQTRQIGLAGSRRQFQEHDPVRPPAQPDAFQRWMQSHREEVERHRGKHIAVHAEKGVLASADDYASLVDELDRQGVPDDQVVVEFIPLELFLK